MAIDENKVDQAALALLYLTLHDGYRVWKGLDWAVTDRLFEKGLIDDPRNRNKSLVFTDEGREAAKAAFERLFAPDDMPAQDQSGTSPVDQARRDLA